MMIFLNLRTGYFIFSLLSHQIYSQALQHLHFEHVLIIQSFFGFLFLISPQWIIIDTLKKRLIPGIFLCLILFIRSEATEGSTTAGLTPRWQLRFIIAGLSDEFAFEFIETTTMSLFAKLAQYYFVLFTIQWLRPFIYLASIRSLRWIYHFTSWHLSSP